MKTLSPFSLDIKICQTELSLFKSLLASKRDLDEQNDILPTFQKYKHLSAFVASCVPSITQYDLLAHEFDIFGDFTADLVVGDSRTKHFLFVEFEDAKDYSIFKKNIGRSTPCWATRVEQGISQVIDWFWKLNDIRQTVDYESRFGTRQIRAHGLVVVGRSMNMSVREKDRLRWRQDSVVCDSKHIEVITYDDLVDDLEYRLKQYS
jgi:hypothetical protein